MPTCRYLGNGTMAGVKEGANWKLAVDPSYHDRVAHRTTLVLIGGHADQSGHSHTLDDRAKPLVWLPNGWVDRCSYWTLFAKEGKAGSPHGIYLAKATALFSRITVTLICPGYCMSFSIF